MGLLAFEGVGDHEPAAVAGEDFDEEVVGGGEFGAVGLEGEPLADGFGVGVPGGGVVEHGADAVGEVGGEREAGADVGGDGGGAGAAVGAFEGELVDAGEAEEAAGEEEGVAGAEGVGEVLLDFA